MRPRADPLDADRHRDPGRDLALTDWALPEVDRLEQDGHCVFHAVRGNLLLGLGRTREAVSALERAVACTDNATERAHLADELAAVRGGETRPSPP